jgi:hypothetical protein
MILSSGIQESILSNRRIRKIRNRPELRMRKVKETEREIDERDEIDREMKGEETGQRHKERQR